MQPIFDTLAITPKQLLACDADAYTLVDLRDEILYEMAHIPGAMQADRDELLSDPSFLSAGKPYVIYCAYGILSEEAAEFLRSRGNEAYHIEGGYREWQLAISEMTAAGISTAETPAAGISSAKMSAAGISSAPKSSLLPTIQEEAEKSLRKTFKKSIMSRFAHAISDYDMIQPGDHIAVCISGGKDSMLMAKCFQELKRRNKLPFELTFLVMNPGYTDVTWKMIENNAALLGIPLTVFDTSIFDAVYEIEKSPCYLCARMRRGHLYHKAKELGCNKIALGHHFDDVIETTLMSILYSGQTQTMMPKLHSTNVEGMELIRPLYLVREADIKRWRDQNGLQFIRCACRFTDTCSIDENSPGTGDSASKRIEAKLLIAELKKKNPNIEMNIFRSMENIHLNAVLGYKWNHQKHSFMDHYAPSEE